MPRDNSAPTLSLQYDQYLADKSGDDNQGNISTSSSTMTYSDQEKMTRKQREMRYGLTTLEMGDLVFQYFGNLLVGSLYKTSQATWRQDKVSMLTQM